jgi:hypothetical protein
MANSSVSNRDWVEVRSKEEILATLDSRGRLDGMPFMPEMLEFCGQRFQVWSSAHKTCDTVNQTGGRRLESSVHLRELRCDGRAHGGCDAGCLLFWKESWLKRDPGADSSSSDTSLGCTEEQLLASVRSEIQDSAEDPAYVCQATLLPEFTTLLPWWDARQYVEDWTSGNVGLGRIVRDLLYSGFLQIVNAGIGVGALLKWVHDRIAALTGGVPYPMRKGSIPVGSRTPLESLELQPGEWVRVRSYGEILATLNKENKNRGLYFDREAVPFCGQKFQVVKRVDQILDERTGRMLRFKTPSVLLDGAYCTSRYSTKRLFCPRRIYPMWRENWLERIAE